MIRLIDCRLIHRRVEEALPTSGSIGTDYLEYVRSNFKEGIFQSTIEGADWWREVICKNNYEKVLFHFASYETFVGAEIIERIASLYNRVGEAEIKVLIEEDIVELFASIRTQGHKVSIETVDKMLRGEYVSFF